MFIKIYCIVIEFRPPNFYFQDLFLIFLSVDEILIQF